MTNKEKEGVKGSIKAVGLVLSAILIFSFCFLIGTVIRARLQSSATTVEDGERVEENSDLTYYLKVKYDGVDRVGTESSDSVTASVYSGVMNVSDKIPDGLTFSSFVTTPTGTIGAVKRSDGVTSCSGQVIDDTGSATGWNAGNTEYVYHGLHYDAASRTVSFRVKSLMAGCQLTVGIITRTPVLPVNVTRMDFFNTAGFIEGDLSGNSNTSHTFIGKKDVATYQVLYEYTGTVPDGAPAAPSETSYIEGATVGIEREPELSGYNFSGWTTSDVTVTGGQFAMPTNTVTFRGSFTAKPSYTLSYAITGDAPEGYYVPKSHSYGEGDIATIDSSAPGDVIDGYIFSGWTTSDAIISEGTITMPAGNVTLTGSFTRIDYAVSYQFDGSVMPAGASSLIPETTRHIPGEIVTVASNPIADGFIFLGWEKEDNFEMPEEDVVIHGSWQEVPGVFRPSISQVITNPKDDYRVTETVKFKITVTNPESFPISNVEIGLNLLGAAFTEDSAYSIRSTRLAEINALAAGASVVLYAEFPVTEDLTKTYTSIAQIMGAEAGNNYVLDTSDEAKESYKASVDFNTLSWNDIPVFTGVNLGNMLPFATLVILGALGGLVSVLHVKKTKSVARGRVSLTGDNRGALSRNSGKRVRRVIVPVLLGVVLISGLLIIGKNVLADKQPVEKITLTSQNTDYSRNEPGAWKVEKSAKWTGLREVRIAFDVDSIPKLNYRDKDLLLVLDCSSSVSSTEYEVMKSDMVAFVEDFMSSGNNRISLMSINGGARILSDFTSDVAIVTDAIRSLSRGGTSSFYDMVLKAETVFDGYQPSSNRDAMMVLVSGGYNTVNNERAMSEYIYFKDIYPYIMTYGVDYTGFCESSDPPDIIRSISDKQLWACPSNLGNVVAPLSGNTAYDSFVITDYIDSSSFDSVISVKTNIGEAEVSSEGNTPVVTWDMGGSYYSGARAHLEINVRLKNNIPSSHEKVFETNERERVASSLSGIPDENFTSTSSPLLQLWYDVTYDVNAPSECSVSGNIPATTGYIPYESVEISSDRLFCEGYLFKGWSLDSDIKKINDDYFAMPLRDVTLKGIWGKIAIDKSMDGTVKTIKDAILDEGPIVNVKLKRLVNPNAASTDTSDRTVTEIRSSDSLPIGFVPSDGNTISAPGSPAKVYAYYEDDTIYIYSYANSIIMNENSGSLFKNFNTLSNVSPIADWDASNVTNLSGAFYYTKLADADVFASWDVSNVENMGEMFAFSKLVDLEGLSSWRTLNVSNMRCMFCYSGVTDLSSLVDWDTSNVIGTSGMFIGTGITSIGSLAGWDMSNVLYMDEMFRNTSLQNADGASGWNTSKVQNMSGMFAETSSLSNIDGLANWNTSSVTDMSEMFMHSSLVDFGALETTQRDGYVSWDVSNVTDMSYMFNNLGSGVDISGIAKWDTSSVVNMSHMFESSFYLGDISALSTTQRDGYVSWDVSSVTDMSYMFSKNASIANIDALINWNTSSVRDMNNMFREVHALEDIDGALNWRTSSVTDMSYMFYINPKLENIDGAINWNTSSVKNMAYMFGYSHINNIDGAANWQNTSLENASYMFYYANQLKNLGSAGGLISASTTNTSYMFYNASLLENIDGARGWDTSGVLDMSYMFASCPKLANIDGAEDWNVSSVENMQFMFAGAQSLEDIDGVINWRPSSVLSMESMFIGTGLTNIDGAINWRPSSVQSMKQMFANCQKLTNIDGALYWTTGSVTDMTMMFASNNMLANINGAVNWDTSSVMSMNSMFASDQKITNIDGAINWDTSSVTNMYNMFAANTSLESIAGAAKWNVSSVTDMRMLFGGDVLINDLSMLETTQRDGYKSWDPMSTARMDSMFGGVPTSVTRPSWAPANAN